MDSENFKIVIAGFDNNPFKIATTIMLAKVLNNKFSGRIQIADCNTGDLQLKKHLQTNVTEEFPVEAKFPKMDLEKCNFCGDCAETCENEAIVIDKLMNQIEAVEDLCANCYKCIENCSASAISKGDTINAGKIVVSSGEEAIQLLEAENSENAIYTKLLIDTLKKKIKTNCIVLFDTVISDIAFDDIISDIDFLMIFADSYASLNFYSDILEFIDKKTGLVTYENNPDINQIKEFAERNNFEFVFEIPFNPKSEEMATKDILEDFAENMSSFYELQEKFYN
ncbi:MAG: hypothetical protein PHD97_03480 [Bacteroidales bacterium]|nr:hypothetical protein [Bacteroidales bacterium]